jgi:hypothetical protein
MLQATAMPHTFIAVFFNITSTSLFCFDPSHILKQFS